ncbi:MAG: glutamine--fructose-6-phosphate transaminase (isomerizing) [Eubacteriales bacterium]|nr:glutamine--fructose-6-phosphate transaminase (isomerizing) [Eubacteriales bacterium]
MCGIAGYIGPRQAAPVLLEALKKLEYRGYDSAGIALIEDGHIQVRKARGRLQHLMDITSGGMETPGHVGIGHTRWATHGEPSDRNSHPHLSNDERFAVVHNGIIENFRQLKEMLISRGYHFHSDTDSEVISNLMQEYDQGSLVETLAAAAVHLEGSYALGVLSLDEPGAIAALRKDSPLIIGRGEGENYLVSDIPAIISHTRDVYLLEDGEIALMTDSEVSFFDAYGAPIGKKVFHVDWDVSAAEKGGFEHFMMKEIMEQPQALQETIRPRIKDGRIDLSELGLEGGWLKALHTIHIVACGSAYHAGRLGKNLIEMSARIPVTVEIASEFRYSDPILQPDHLVILVSQSGETADSIAALREAKRQGVKTLAIVNVLGSTIAREADHVLYTWAGPEIAVATTKAYTAQVAALVLFSGYIAQERGSAYAPRLNILAEALLKLPEVARQVLDDHSRVQYLASLFFNHRDIYFIGRGIDYSLSLEGSLKLKEISYIHSEAQPAGELKHGTISLIQPGTLVIALATQKKLRDKMLSNIQEVRARGAVVLSIAARGDKEIAAVSDHFIGIPPLSDELEPILAVMPLQLFAYYVAALNGNDVDKPRNLAKSVTVE